MITPETLEPWIDKSPYFTLTQEAGCLKYTVLNHMHMPYYYGDPVEEYWSLVNDVTLWDVAAERQVEISGPDARAFVELITPRDLAACKVGQCRYILMTDARGGIINDPVLARLDDDRFWLSAADADIHLWCAGLAQFAGMDVRIDEPECAPLQIQGKKSGHVIDALFGREVAALPYYHLTSTELNGIPVIVTRTGWSGDLGFEIYLLETARARELWAAVLEAGKPHGIRVTGPNSIRRIEAGIAAYRSDFRSEHNPYEIGLGRLVDLDKDADFVGKAVLKKVAAEGVKRRLVGIELDAALPGTGFGCAVSAAGQTTGHTTAAVRSPRLDKEIGYAWVNAAHAAIGTALETDAGVGSVAARIVEMPFYDPKKADAKRNLQSALSAD